MSEPQFQKLLRIGSGGMGEVLLAVMNRDGQSELVALKRIHREYLHDEEAVSRFLREQRITALLSHPNIVALKHFGEDKDGPWLALEYVHGRGLSELVNTLAKTGAQLPLDAALVIARDVAAALAYAHEVPVPETPDRGVLHRDLSPDNVLVAYEGKAKLADFGIAQQMGSTRITQTGMVRGKFGYLSPELHDGGDATRASDVFALAATLYLLFTGAPPFHGKSDVELVRAVLETDPTPPSTLRPELPIEVSNWLTSALSKTRATRPRDLRGLVRLLELALGQDELLARASLQRVMSEAFPENVDRRRQEVTNAIEQRRRTATMASVEVVRPPRRRRRSLLVSASALLLVGAGGYAVARVTAPPTPPPVIDTTPIPLVIAPIDAGEVEEVVDAGSPVVPQVIDAGTTTRHRKDQKGSGELWIRVQPWAHVYVDGEAKGTTPLEPFKLREGKHTVLLVNDKLDVSRTMTVVVRKGARKELTVTLKKKP